MSNYQIILTIYCFISYPLIIWVGIRGIDYLKATPIGSMAIPMAQQYGKVKLNKISFFLVFILFSLFIVLVPVVVTVAILIFLPGLIKSAYRVIKKKLSKSKK